jgi:hypothetical protein
VASYAEAGGANSARRRIQHLRGDHQIMAGPVALHRETHGKVTVTGPVGETTPEHTLLDKDVGLALGLLVPELLLSTAIACGVDATVKGLIGRHEQRRLGADVHEFLASGRSAVAVLAVSGRVDRMCRALGRSGEAVEIPVNPSDYRALRSALTDAPAADCLPAPWGRRTRSARRAAFWIADDAWPVYRRGQCRASRATFPPVEYGQAVGERKVATWRRSTRS